MKIDHILLLYIKTIKGSASIPGRLSIYNDTYFKHDIAQTLGTFKDDIQHLTPNYNTAPTINIPIFTNTRHYTYAYFGLIL